MFVSRILKYARRVITPLVSGVVVTLIGMSLIKVGITACGGGEAAKATGTFGSFENVGIAALVLVLIVFSIAAVIATYAWVPLSSGSWWATSWLGRLVW